MGAWSLYVLNAAGSLLFQRAKSLPLRPFAEVAVLQALHTTSQELRFPLSVLTTKDSCIAMKTYGSEDDSLLFVLETKGESGESSLMEQRCIAKLDLLYEGVLMVVGRKDLQPSAFLQQERLKKELKYGTHVFDSILDSECSLLLSNHTSMSADLQQALSALMAELQIDYLAVWKRKKLYMCSMHWNDLSTRDQMMLGRFQVDAGLADKPVFLPNSSLAGEEKGTIPLRFISTPLNAEFTVGVLCGKILKLSHFLGEMQKMLTPALCKTLSALSFNQANLDLQTPSEILAWACFEGKSTLWRCFSRDDSSLPLLLDTRWLLEFSEGQYSDRLLRVDSSLIVGIKKGQRILWTLAGAQCNESDIKTLSEAIIDYIVQYLDNTSHVFAGESRP